MLRCGFSVFRASTGSVIGSDLEEKVLGARATVIDGARVHEVLILFVFSEAVDELPVNPIVFSRFHCNTDSGG